MKKLFISALVASVAGMAAASASIIINVGDRTSHGILNLDRLVIKASTEADADDAVVLSSGGKIGVAQICSDTDLNACKNVSELCIGSECDTHYESHNIVGNSISATGNSSTTNPYLNHVENGTVTSHHKITGTGGITVSSDNSGNITISGGTTNGGPSNHYTGYNIVGTGGSLSNASSTNNDNTYLNHIENNTKTSSIQIKGDGSVRVSANNGTITISGTDNNTHYTGKVVAGSSTATTNSTSDVSDPYINYVENGSVRSGVQLKAGTNTSVKAKNGIVTITANGDGDTHYTGKVVAGSSTATTNSTTDVSDPYINYVENGSVRSGVQLKAGNATTSIKARNGVITISVVNLEALGLGSYWKLNGSTLSTSGGSYSVNLANNLTVTGTTKLRGNLDFAWMDDSSQYNYNKITTSDDFLNIKSQNVNITGTTNIDGALTVKNNDILVNKSNGKIKVNQICDQNNSNCKLVSELSTGGGNSYWKLSSSALQITSGYGLNVSANNDKSFNFSINDPDLSTPLKTNLKIDGNGVNITKGGLNVTGVTKMNNNLTVTAGGLNVTGATTLNNNLTVKGTTTANNTVNITANGLNVTGATTLNNNLTVKGTTTANNTVNITAGGLNVTGNTTLKNNLTVGNNITAGGTTTLNGNLVVNQWAQFYNSLSVTSGNLTVVGNATVNSGLTVSKNATIYSGLTVYTNNGARSTFYINNNWNNSKGRMTMVGETLLSGVVETKDNVTLNGKLDIQPRVSAYMASSADNISRMRLKPTFVYSQDELETYMPCTSDIEGTIIYVKRRNNTRSEYVGRIQACGCYAPISNSSQNTCSWHDIEVW